MKPTAYHLMVAAILGFGLLTDRPTLKLVLGQAYPGLTDLGWTKLTREECGKTSGRFSTEWEDDRG